MRCGPTLTPVCVPMLFMVYVYIDFLFFFCKQQLNKLLIFYSTVVSQSLVLFGGLLKALHFSQTAAFDNTVQDSP